MNKFVPLILSLIILSACSNIPFLKTNQDAEEKVTGNRGIQINFVKDQPPEQITENERFFIRLQGNNYLPETTTATTTLYPDIILPITPDDLQNFQSITLQPSNYYEIEGLSAAAKEGDTKNNIKPPRFAPGKITTVSTAKITPEKDLLLGPYTIQLDQNSPQESFRFALDYTYDIKTTLKASYCAYDPGYTKKISCPEQLIETKLGPAKYLPITITKIEKKLLSTADNKYEVHLWIYFEDKGKGIAEQTTTTQNTNTQNTNDLSKYLLSQQKTNEKIQVHLLSQDSYTCKQDPYYGKEAITGLFAMITGKASTETTPTTNYDLNLNNGKALLKCYTTFDSKQTENAETKEEITNILDHQELDITLDYQYTQRLVTPTITVKKFE
ncbi:MAG: hypothetical protein Q7R56_03370 [Nanoarchaeota archaeon]|nr:hypothetical protein [Nanoarchaeota archaeon]